MHRLSGDSIMVGFVTLSLLLAGAAYAKPWRNIELIPASRIKWRGNKVQPITIMTDPPVAPGPHTPTGVISVRYLTGVAAWNAAGQRETLPVGIPTLLEEQYDIDLEFTMTDY